MLKNGPILVLRTGALGDMVQFSAVIAALADHHDQPVDVLTQGGFADQVLTGMPEIGRFFALRHRHRPAWLAPDLVLLARTLAQRRYSEAYTFDRSPVIERSLAMSGTHLHTALSSSAVHNLDNYAAVLDRLGVVAPRPLLPRVVVTDLERRSAQELLQRHALHDCPLIVIQPGNSRTLHPLHRLRPQRNLKAWPSASWSTTLVALARQYPTVGFALLGAPSEWRVCQEVLAGLPPAIQQRTANLALELPISSLKGLLERARGCLSVDTGPAHLAAAVGCPSIVLFGPADPAAMAPRGPTEVRTVVSGVSCSPCYGTPRRVACRDNVCMRSLQVAQVLEAWTSLQHAATTRMRLTA